MRTRVKFCGCRTPQDARWAVACGVDAVGMIFAPSQRQVTLEQARAIAVELPPFVTPVGVFVDAQPAQIEAACVAIPGLMLQLSGSESPEFVASLGGRAIKVLHIEPQERDTAAIRLRAQAFGTGALLFDTKVGDLAGGTGQPFAWETIAPLAQERPIIVAGGLRPENVAACIRAVRPYAVDVSSGIETGGEKDLAKMRAFMVAVQDETKL